MNTSVALATHAAVNGGTVHPTSEAGSIGVVIIWLVGIVIIIAMVLLMEAQSREEKKRHEEFLRKMRGETRSSRARARICGGE